MRRTIAAALALSSLAGLLSAAHAPSLHRNTLPFW